MVGHPALLKLLEYYQRYWLLITVAIFLNSVILFQINKKLLRIYSNSDLMFGSHTLKKWRIDPIFLLCLFAITLFMFINLSRDDFDSMEFIDTALGIGVMGTKYSLKVINIMLTFAHQPIHPLLVNLSTRFISTNHYNIFLRSISVLFGILAAYVTYCFSLKIFDKKAVSCLVFLLLSINGFFYFYSRRIEPYTLFCFLALLSYYYFWVVFISGERRKLWRYAAVNILCFFTHYISLCVIISQILTILTLKWRKYPLTNGAFLYFIKALLIFGFIVILAAPAIFVSILNNSFAFAIKWENNFYLANNYLKSIIINIAKLVLGIPPSVILTYPLILFFFIVILKIRRHNPVFFILTLSVCSIGIIYEALLLLICWRKSGGLYFNARHFIWLVPFVAIIYGWGTYAFINQSRLYKKVFGYVSLLIIILGNLYTSATISFRPTAPAYKEVAKLVRNQFQNKDFVGYPVGWYPIDAYLVDTALPDNGQAISYGEIIFSDLSKKEIFTKEFG